MGIVYNGGQHAREWISPMTNAWIANQLVTLYGKDAQITNFVDNIEWTIIPIVNVDGYVYTWTTDRMWRKNRYVLILLNPVVKARVRLADVSVCASLSCRGAAASTRRAGLVASVSTSTATGSSTGTRAVPAPTLALRTTWVRFI